MMFNPRDPRVQAIFLRFHVKLMASGLNSRQITRTEALKLAGQVTGKTYKRGQHAIAASDLDAWIAANP